MGAFERPAVGSSVFNSPFVELTTCQREKKYIYTHEATGYIMIKTKVKVFKLES